MLRHVIKNESILTSCSFLVVQNVIDLVLKCAQWLKYEYLQFPLFLIIGSNPPVPQTDIFGIPIAVPKTDAFGFPLLRPLTDAYNHLPITDNQGSTFLVPVPSNGSHPTPQPETDAFHNPVLVPKTDVYGQPVTDKSGNPIMVPKPYSQVTPTTTPQTPGSIIQILHYNQWLITKYKHFKQRKIPQL